MQGDGGGLLRAVCQTEFHGHGFGNPPLDGKIAAWAEEIDQVAKFITKTGFLLVAEPRGVSRGDENFGSPLDRANTARLHRQGIEAREAKGMDIIVAEPLQGEALDFAHGEGVVGDEGAIQRSSVLGDGGAGILEEVAPFQNAIQNMAGGNPEALAGSDGQSVPQKILAANDDRIDLGGKAILPRWGYNSKPLDAGLLGERNIVVMARGRLWRSQADFFIERGQERSKGWRVTGSGLAKS